MSVCMHICVQLMCVCVHVACVGSHMQNYINNCKLQLSSVLYMIGSTTT